MFIWLEAIGKLLLSALLGGIIGWEREKQHKPAGFRTVMLVSLASTIYVMSATLAAERSGETLDVVRAMAGIAQGIGFLGAGVILQSRAEVRWLTTAASLWAAAGIGYAVGVGVWEVAVLACALVFIILHWMNKIADRWLRSENSHPPSDH
ncbi:MAG: MgtC/SapB family protein [Chloroflexi bacterium]|nr:MgtC/SapB family protein [Chloroflexota bacterium]